MTDKINIWWSSMEFGEQLFWGIAIFSSILFSIQFLLSIIGMDSDTDADTSLSGDGEFTIFSIRSILAFLLFFGWTGVILTNNGMSLQYTILIAFIAGLLAMVVVAYILFKLFNLTEVGTISIDSCIGNTAEVYIPIPSRLNGKGKVLVGIDNKTMELLAVTNNERIETGVDVIVLDVLENNILLVETFKTK